MKLHSILPNLPAPLYPRRISREASQPHTISYPPQHHHASADPKPNIHSLLLTCTHRTALPLTSPLIPIQQRRNLAKRNHGRWRVRIRVPRDGGDAWVFNTANLRRA